MSSERNFRIDDKWSLAKWRRLTSLFDVHVAIVKKFNMERVSTSNDIIPGDTRASPTCALPAMCLRRERDSRARTLRLSLALRRIYTSFQIRYPTFACNRE